jgi:hypothetical protein
MANARASRNARSSKIRSRYLTAGPAAGEVRIGPAGIRHRGDFGIAAVLSFEGDKGISVPLRLRNENGKRTVEIITENGFEVVGKLVDRNRTRNPENLKSLCPIVRKKAEGKISDSVWAAAVNFAKLCVGETPANNVSIAPHNGEVFEGNIFRSEIEDKVAALFRNI